MTNSPTFLILDKWPQSGPQTAWIFAKVFVKEGLLRNSWRGVVTFGRPYGSRRIPDELCRSLSNLGNSYKRNTFAPMDSVVVLGDVRCLRWAIELKRQGKIRTLIAGPFVATMPFEYDRILLSREIDTLLFLCTWHRDMFVREANAWTPQPQIWSAGVDSEYWAPDPALPRDQVLVFKKDYDPALAALVFDTLKQRNITYRVIEYGKYAPDEYREELRRSRFSIVLHRSETQGMSTFEAWSCDVPTLHFSSGTMDFLGTKYPGAESSPYLTPSCGLKFTQTREFPANLDEIMNQLSRFSPRQFVLNGHTNTQSAQRFLKIVREAGPQRGNAPDMIEQSH